MKKRIIFFCLALLLLAPFCWGGEPNLDLAWRISFRERNVGYSISHFSSVYRGEDVLLKEEGIKKISADIAVMKIAFFEETQTLWDTHGFVKEFASDRDINGAHERREANRKADGSVAWRLVKGGETYERVYKREDFDYTGRDLYLNTLEKKPGPVSYRVLSVSDGNVHTITYQALGLEEVMGSTGLVSCSRISIKSSKGDGVFLVNDLGLPLCFNLDFFLGAFSFSPCALDEANRAIFGYVDGDDSSPEK